MKYNVICDRCGARYKAQELIKEPQTGYMVCRFCLDPRRQINMAPHPYRAQIPWSSPPLAIDVSLPVTGLLNPGSLQIQSGLLIPTLIGNLSPGSVSITGTDLNDFRGDGRFLAIQDSIDDLAFSSDDNGVTWGSITLSASLSCQSIAYGTPGFVIVGLSQTAMYSATGNSGDWTNATMPDLVTVANEWWRVRWILGADGTTGEIGEGCFAATNNGGGEYRIAISPDGSTWTLMNRVDTGLNQLAKGAVAFSPTLGSGQGRWVAVGRSSGGKQQSRYSDDGGDTWSNGSGLTIGSDWDDIIWSDRLSLFIAGANTDRVAYSADGITFTTLLTAVGAHLIESDDLIVGCKLSDSKNAYSTANAVDWTTHDNGGTTNYNTIAWNGVVYGMGSYGASSNFKNFITSPDLNTWTEYTNNVPTTNLIGLIARWI